MKITKNKKKGFTIAEVLVTLTIVGILAGILFPSILANYTERTLKAKRSAFVARMSQAMGELADKFAGFENVTCGDPADIYTCTDNATALQFINEGLSKVYKIAAVCDKDSLSACDIPDLVTKKDGTTLLLHSAVTDFKTYEDGAVKFEHKVAIPYINLLPAAFITKNGESVLVFVNPNCTNREAGNQAQESLMCANMIFDLNGGKNKPNKVGEDIWYLSVFYSSSPTVAAPRTLNFDDFMYIDTTVPATGESTKEHYFKNKGSAGRLTYQQANNICAAMGDNVVLPSFEDAMALMLNLPLETDSALLRTSTTTAVTWHTSQKPIDFWTATPCDEISHKISQVDYGVDFNDCFCWKDTDVYYGVPMCVLDD